MMITALLFWLVPVGLLGILVERASKKVQWSVTALIFALGFIPLGSLLLMQHWMSFAGHLSISAIVWATWRFGKRKALGEKSDRLALLALTSFVLLFYVLALGVGMFDPYRLGFSQPIIPIGLMVTAGLLGIWRGYVLFAATMVMALLAYAVNLLPSNNIWDYVLDPIMLIILIVQMIRVWLCKS